MALRRLQACISAARRLSVPASEPAVSVGAAPDAAAPVARAAAASQHRDGGAPSEPPQHVYLRVRNAPRLAMHAEVVATLAGVGLPVTPADVRPHYGEHLSFQNWTVRLPGTTDVDALVHKLSNKAAVLGSRALFGDHATSDVWAEEPGQVKGFRGRSALVSGLPVSTTVGELETLFAQYSVAPDAFSLMKAAPRERGVEEARLAVVRFATATEAARAVREKHREVVGERMVMLRLLQ